MSTHMHASEDRGRLVVIGTWLIGLGVVFLVREVTGWTWGQAWPLFVILLGVGSTVSAYVWRARSRLGIWSVWWPVSFVVVGFILLASTTDMLGIGLNQLVAWWPVLVIGLGVWFLIGAVFARESNMTVESLAVPLGDLSAAEIRVNFGGGELRLGQAPPGMLISGRFTGGVVQRTRGPGRIELQPYDPPAVFWNGRPLDWDMGVTTEIPVDLRLDSGANRSNMDLGALRVRRLELHTGASETHLRLPAQGATSVRIEAGLASVEVDVPQGVAARIKGRMGLGSVNVDEARFPRSLDGWASPDYESASDRVEIDVQGGLGSVRIR